MPLIEESPAAKHKRSSGKNGKKKAAVKTILSLPFIFLSNKESSFLPQSAPAARTPSFLLIINAIKLPSVTPINEYNPPKKQPNIATPAAVVISPGKGNAVTCNACKIINAGTANAPNSSIFWRKTVTSRNILLIPLFCPIYKTAVSAVNRAIAVRQILYTNPSFFIATVKAATVKNAVSIKLTVNIKCRRL